MFNHVATIKQNNKHIVTRMCTSLICLIMLTSSSAQHKYVVHEGTNEH